jgi:hypothetical protein
LQSTLLLAEAARMLTDDNSSGGFELNAAAIACHRGTTVISQRIESMARIAFFAVGLALVGFVLVCASNDPLQAQPQAKGNEGDYMTLSELSRLCNESGRCGERLCCEDKEVKVKGYLDYVNIFHPKTYPNVSRVKFRIFDGPRITQTQNPWAAYQDALEVYPIKGNVEHLFDKLIKMSGLPLKTIYLKGTIRGLNAPTQRTTFRLFNLTVDADDVFMELEMRDKPRP